MLVSTSYWQLFPHQASNSRRVQLIAILFIITSFATTSIVATTSANANRPIVNPVSINQQPSSDSAQNYFTDTELINQDGQTMRFYSDVLKDRVVVINCFFTTCTSICPPMTRNLEKIQEALADKLGNELLIVSITVDPVTDTPQRLREYAQRFNARSGRLFLTGKKENVEFILKKLGTYVADKNDHNSILLIGNVKTGLWKKAFGMAKADELITVVQSVIDDKGN